MVTAISSVNKASSFQGVKASRKNSSSSLTSSFDSYLLGNLKPGKDGTINEEELFSALIGERLSTLKGGDVERAYQRRLSYERRELKSEKGYVPEERAALRTLKHLVRGGILSKEDAGVVYSQAFQASNLDQIKDVLYDSNGGDADPTVAEAKLKKAIQKAEKVIRGIESGEVATIERDFSMAKPTGWPVPSIANTMPDPGSDADQSGSISSAGRGRGNKRRQMYSSEQMPGIPAVQKLSDA